MLILPLFAAFFPQKPGGEPYFLQAIPGRPRNRAAKISGELREGVFKSLQPIRAGTLAQPPKKTARAHLLTTFTGGARAASGGEPGSESAIIHLRREKGSRRHESGLVSASSLESDEISWRGLKRLYEASRSSKMDKRTEYRTEERRLIKFHDGFNLHQIGL